MQVILKIKKIKNKKSALIDTVINFTLRQTAECPSAFPTNFFSLSLSLSLSQGRLHYKRRKEEYQYHF